jgi:hypothetical protein
MSLKNPVTPGGIDPGTVRPVAQRLNHYGTPGPSHTCYFVVISADEFRSVEYRKNWLNSVKIG